jgi:hypothetical protein
VILVVTFGDLVMVVGSLGITAVVVVDIGETKTRPNQRHHGANSMICFG